MSDNSSATTLTDNKGNTWVQDQNYSPNSFCVVYSVKNPAVGTGHTFSTVGTHFASLCVLAFSGTDITSQFDQVSVASGTGVNSTSAGSITPGADNAVVVSAVGLNGTGTVSINSGFSITDAEPQASGQDIGTGAAYLIQTTAAAANPTWSSTGTDLWSSVNISYLAGAAAPPAVPQVTVSGDRRSGWASGWRR